MKEILKKYATSFILKNTTVGEVLNSVELCLQPRLGALCKKASILKDVVKVVEDPEWDNVRCYVIDVTLNQAASEGPDLHLIVKVSRIAPVATMYWLKYEDWFIDGNRVPAGRRFSGNVSLNALTVGEEISRLLHFERYFVVPLTDFDFELGIHSEKEKAQQTTSGMTFFFG